MIKIFVSNAIAANLLAVGALREGTKIKMSEIADCEEIKNLDKCRVKEVISGPESCWTVLDMAKLN